MSDTTIRASLGAKLDALDLTADEHALLADLLAPDDAEVTGYTASFTGMLSGMTLNRPLARPGSTNTMAGAGSGGI